MLFSLLPATLYSAALYCGSDWIVDPATGHCYKAFSSYVFEWYDARENCLQWGADLVSITSDLEADVILGNTQGVQRRMVLEVISFFFKKSFLLCSCCI